MGAKNWAGIKKPKPNMTGVPARVDAAANDMAMDRKKLLAAAMLKRKGGK